MESVLNWSVIISIIGVLVVLTNIVVRHTGRSNEVVYRQARVIRQFHRGRRSACESISRRVALPFEICFLDFLYHLE